MVHGAWCMVDGAQTAPGNEIPGLMVENPLKWVCDKRPVHSPTCFSRFSVIEPVISITGSHLPFAQCPVPSAHCLFPICHCLFPIAYFPSDRIPTPAETRH